MTGLDSSAMLRAIEEELERLREVRILLAGESSGADWPPPTPAAKRNLSSEARQRIVDAQKRRWAAQKANA